MVNKMNNYNG
jgi:hypothetical protein